MSGSRLSEEEVDYQRAGWPAAFAAGQQYGADTASMHLTAVLRQVRELVEPLTGPGVFPSVRRATIDEVWHVIDAALTPVVEAEVLDS